MWDDVLVKWEAFTKMRDEGFCGLGWAMIALESKEYSLLDSSSA